MTDKLKKVRAFEENALKGVKDGSRPVYHLTGSVGWINDPNGFSLYKGEIHLFFQANPYSTAVGPIHWGHVKSRDFVRWERLPAALAPDMPYDKDGCFSGGAVELPDGRQMILYTGHAEGVGADGGILQTQCVAFGDGINYTKVKENPVIGTEAIPEGGWPSDFRDPKLIACDGFLRGLVVNKDDSGTGAVLMYDSRDGLSWEYRGTIAENRGRLGVMWECPDMFTLDGRDVLLFSVQEMKEKPGELKEGFEAIAFIGTFDDEAARFHEESVRTIDHGSDFYAPTTMLAADGRRIMTAWMQDWNTSADFPGTTDFCGQMILPRELHVRDGKLIQQPVREIEAFRKERAAVKGAGISARTEMEGVCGRTTDIVIHAVPEKKDARYGCFRIVAAANDKYRTTVEIDADAGLVTVDLTDSGNPKSMCVKRCFKADFPDGGIDLRMMLDRYSMELFFNGGEHAASFVLYTPQEADGISFEADNGYTADVACYEIEV